MISGGKMPSESSEVKKGYQHGNGNQKTYDLIPDLIWLIYIDLKFDNFWRSLSKGGQMVVGFMCLYKRLTYVVAKSMKTCLINL